MKFVLRMFGCILLFWFSGGQLWASADWRQYHSDEQLLEFGSRHASFAVAGQELKINFVGARTISPRGHGATGGAEPDTDASFREVHYRGLWRGINLSFRAAPGGIAESVYHLEPGADISDIHLRYNNPISLDANGNLVVMRPGGFFRESAPIAWQEREGTRLPIAVRFSPRGDNDLGFVLGNHDPSLAVWIDPLLTWNTFLGGPDNDVAEALETDADGNIYVVGYSRETWGSPIRNYSGAQDVFVAKLDPNGTLLWNTFLGGNGNDLHPDVALDGSGNVYVVGTSDFFGWGSPVVAFSGTNNAFAAMLDTNGNLLWNTFLGGASGTGKAVAVDGGGNVYVGGSSTSTWGTPIRPFAGVEDAYAAKLDVAGNLLWHTFLGSAVNTDAIEDLVVDAAGNLYLDGQSRAAWGSPISAFSGASDIFVAALSTTGTLNWLTFLGGVDHDSSTGIRLDGSGAIYLAGSSAASWGSPVRSFTAGYEGMAAKLDNGGNLLWNTFLGGASQDYSSALVLDAVGNVYVAGWSESSWGSPLGAFGGGSSDSFVGKLDNNGNLLWNSFVGVPGQSEAQGIAENGGNIYLAGFSVVNWGSPVRAFSGGSSDGYVAALPPYFAIAVAPIPAGGTVAGGTALLCGAAGTSCVEYVGAGDSLMLDIIPSTGLEIAGVSGCGGSLAGAVYTTSPINADCVIAANFLPIGASGPAQTVPGLDGTARALLTVMLAIVAILFTRVSLMRRSVASRFQKW